MGDCKDSLTAKTEESKSVLSGILGKRREKRKVAAAANFAEMLAAAHVEVDRLVTVKQTELQTEKGKEEQNRMSLALLNTISFHIEEAVNLADEYVNGNQG